MNRKVVYWLMAGVMMFSCSKQPEQSSTKTGKLNGLQKFFYPDGSLYLEANYRDSVAHGLSKQYFKNGQVFEEAVYVNGKIHGIKRTYYEDGKLSSETPYDSGRVHGVKKKFRKDGTVAYEAPFHYDKPCVGLKEFYLSGNPVKNYPTIVVKQVNRLLKDDLYVVELSLSNNNTRVQFYEGRLSEGKYIGNDVRTIHTVDGIGKIYYSLPPGAYVMESLNIIAEVKTDLGNDYITQRSYNLAAENR